MKTVIQTRIDSSVRQSAENILNSMGLSLNDGIRMFLHQLVTDRAMPFRPSVGDKPNEMVKFDDVAKEILSSSNVPQVIPKAKSLFFVDRGRGLPIGNLTSQIFANFYLKAFPHVDF